ncbi:hypothetical protein GE061_002247 [Apolygus lucorum]|uniref:THAP-type domain-containing protein n=1 Tax=Apolygus lucorum TaxID=248454 RepID=A0A8S9X614_APOLU|nr:hypothetical protein GE061_002247 [Apolygus lucorum]
MRNSSTSKKMPRRCSVPGCRSNYREKFTTSKYVSCYGFPSDPQTLEKWLSAIKRRNFVPNYDNAVCAKHFDESAFSTEDAYRGADGELKVFKFAKPKLKNDAVPSLFLGGNFRNSSQFRAEESRRMSEMEDSKTCLDFVEVEMKSSGNEERNENASVSVDIGESSKMENEEKTCICAKTLSRTIPSNCFCSNGIPENFENNFENRIVVKAEESEDSSSGETKCLDLSTVNLELKFGKISERSKEDRCGCDDSVSDGFGGENGGFTDSRMNGAAAARRENKNFDGNGVLGERRPGRSESGVAEDQSKVKVGNREFVKDKDGSPSEEWEGGWIVKEELFRGLGLVPRGVLHDRSVDRRHCVIGQRRSEAVKGPSKTAVFYPPGTAMFDTERFIGEIQRRPAIYDVRSKVYSNRVAKLKYWHEVGKEMYKGWDALDQMERRTLVKELQIKWKSIRDHFMRQLKQNMNGEGPKKKKYVHFDQLQFLTANLGVKRPRHSFKPPKHEPEEEYMELTPELPEERHFSFMTSVERPDYDEHEVPVAAALLPQQPEDLSYHPKDLSYHHRKELSYHKELEGDRMGNKMFLLSLLPIMERLPDHSNIRARLQLMEVLQTFVAHEDLTHRDFYNYHDEKRSCGDVSQQHSTASHSDSDT